MFALLFIRVRFAMYNVPAGVEWAFHSNETNHIISPFDRSAFIPLGACGRFSNPATNATAERYVVISPIYNEIIWALGAQDRVVGVDLSSTYPAEVKNVQTVGYHRALSAEGILSLHPTAVIDDGNIGPPQVVEQIKGLNIPMKTFDGEKRFDRWNKGPDT